MPILQLSKVSKTFDGPEGGQPVRVFEDINLELNEGQSAAIVGPSGSGKSTLLNLIGALDKPTSGIINVDGKNILELKGQETAAFRNQTIGFIFQLHHLLPQCTVMENIIVPSLAGHTREHKGVISHRARSLLSEVGLAQRLQHRPAELSGGERQRASVARALINQPRILLADEPTGALDKANSDRLVEILLKLNREKNLTLVVITHSLEVAQQMEHVYRLDDGTLSRM